CRPFRAWPGRRSPRRRAGFPWSGAPWVRIHYWYWTGGYVYRNRKCGRDRRQGVTGNGKRETGNGPHSHDPRPVQGVEERREHRRERRLPHGRAGCEEGVHRTRDRDHRGPDPVRRIREWSESESRAGATRVVLARWVLRREARRQGCRRGPRGPTRPLL